MNEKEIGGFLSELIHKVDADFVRQRAGFAIGGVPPVGHLEQLKACIDEDLLHHEAMWAAAGNANAVFSLIPAERVYQGGRSGSRKHLKSCGLIFIRPLGAI